MYTIQEEKIDTILKLDTSGALAPLFEHNNNLLDFKLELQSWLEAEKVFNPEHWFSEDEYKLSKEIINIMLKETINAITN